MYIIYEKEEITYNTTASLLINHMRSIYIIFNSDKNIFKFLCK